MAYQSTSRVFTRFGCALVAVLILAIASETSATVIRMNYTVGGSAFGSADFRMFDTAMPNSVANFLGYFDRYPGTFIHRNPRGAGVGGAGGNFVVQGGGFEFVPPSSAPSITLDASIPDEPGGGVQGISNLRGTLSNAKSGPDTVTSQWFINLGDNSFLDSPARSDGGFAAFGRVIGNGMVVFDAIDLLQKLDLDGSGSSLFNDVPVGDVNDALGSLVILQSITVLSNPDGDYNFDGTVDAADYTVWRNTLGSTTLVEADGNGNGVVDAADFTVWQSNFGSGSSTATTVPEPTTVSLLLLALAGSTRRLRADR